MSKVRSGNSRTKWAFEAALLVRSRDFSFLPYLIKISAQLASKDKPATNSVSNLGQIFSRRFNCLGLRFNSVDWFKLSSRNVDSRPNPRRFAWQYEGQNIEIES